MIEQLDVWYPILPPTANKIYVRGSILRTEARQYREEFRKFLHTNYGHLIQELPNPKKDPNIVFKLVLVMHLNCLNESWNNPKIHKSRRSDTRYKRIDLTNRIKFFEDCIKDAVDIDDSLTFEAAQYKMHSPDKEGIRFILQVAKAEHYGVPIVDPQP
jgi:hypothetical protein